MRQLLPVPDTALDSSHLTDEQLLDLYRPANDPDSTRDSRAHPWIRFNFISSIDGSATIESLSGGLGTDGDKRLFQLLRRTADVILVGAGTMRAEGYEGGLLDPTSQEWRIRHRLPLHPVVAVISGSLNMDPKSQFFIQAPVRPLIFTCARAPSRARRMLSEVAEIVDCGSDRVNPLQVSQELAERGHQLINAEGGPAVLGSFVAAGILDELCLTISPLLAGPQGLRIFGNVQNSDSWKPLYPHPLKLCTVLEEDSALFLRYVKPPVTHGGPEGTQGRLC